MAASAWSRLPFIWLQLSVITLSLAIPDQSYESVHRVPQSNPVAPSSNPFDNSWIANWAVIGDSYAAGLGAGQRLDYGCSRYSGGYPSLIAADDRFGVNPNRTSQFLACSGKTTSDILDKQVPYAHDNLDLLLISAGGNDVLLGDVLDSCIFQWKNGDTEKCERTLDNSQSLIDHDLPNNLDKLLDAVIPKLQPEGRIYWPGYAQFFGESPFCNNVSWSVWPWMPMTEKQMLTLERRQLMNNMVAQTNLRIKEAIERANNKVNKIGKHQIPSPIAFVDWDWTSRMAEGRFCEMDVKEPDPMRNKLMFFEWNTLDDGDDPTIITRPADPVPADSFEGSIGKWALETLAEHPDWLEFGPDGTEPVNLDPNLIEVAMREREAYAETGLDGIISWFVPDSWKRVFHPRALGHRIIADMVLHTMAVDRAKWLKIQPPEPQGYARLELR
ncbi:SGNH hydrolase [Eremomyces bilateralis CBS 781.70]|uniref:SGNH hydrolase n=1 Tax=Eremomyces bilateralis CBS 781.70 TaxID=1392243 RepID=A0A6G1G4C9_9PEZI|nr:SGNH hydrolase [Eremomyces bilateralis CBS 781.70]KAF1812927.1 SGNH hydrolase [Eremomyces bilateralis CBS 781.70]